jgi:two-component system invasion response regulator UvrY
MKILIADDHTIVRDGIIRVLEEAFPFGEIIGVSDTASLLQCVLDQKWDVIISDITMPPGDSGLDALKQIKEMSPATPVIIMSMHSAEQYAVRAFKSGAKGFLTKDAASLELVKAINTVLSGKKYVSEEVSMILADSFVINPNERSVENLSNRELEVFKLLANGKSVTDIAKSLHLSSNTVSTFRMRIFEKMNFKNNLELIRYAVDSKLLD